MNQFVLFLFILFSIFNFCKNENEKKEKPFPLKVFSCIIHDETLEEDIIELLKLGFNKEFSSLLQESFKKYPKLAEVYRICYEKLNNSNLELESKEKENLHNSDL